MSKKVYITPEVETAPLFLSAGIMSGQMPSGTEPKPGDSGFGGTTIP